jgi:hypothetical protein
MNYPIGTPFVGRTTPIDTGGTQGSSGPGRTTPAGQSGPLGFTPPTKEPVQDQAFMSFRPELASPQTANLFSSDPSIQALLSNPNVDMETIILAQMALNNKQLDTLNASKATEVQANQKLNEKIQAERIKEIQANKEKVEAAANKSWWSKLLDVVANVATFVASAAVLVGAILAAPATGGLSLAVGALALYQLISSGAELVNKGFEAITGERLFDFKLTIGAGIAALAGVFGASDEVKQWIELGVDLVVNVAAMFLIPGAQLSAIGRIVKAVSTIIAGVSQVSKGSLDISRAFDVKDLADSQARLDTLQAQIDRLTQNNKQLMEMLKIIQEAKADNENTATEALQAKAETGRRIVMA